MSAIALDGDREGSPHVLSSPKPPEALSHRLRYRLAWDHDVCRRVAAVVLRAVFRLLKDHAGSAGLEQPCGGAVAVIQRFGGALNLNVHIHALVRSLMSASRATSS